MNTNELIDKSSDRISLSMGMQQDIKEEIEKLMIIDS